MMLQIVIDDVENWSHYYEGLIFVGDAAAVRARRFVDVSSLLPDQ